MKKIVYILKKDLVLEWRQKYSLYGLILYLVSSVLAINILQESPEGTTWNSLFWLILLFISVNAVAKSFLQESKNRFIYYYTLHKPSEIIVAKMLYNIVLMIGMSLLSYFLFFLILGNQLLTSGIFLLMVVTGGMIWLCYLPCFRLLPAWPEVFGPHSYFRISFGGASIDFYLLI